MNSEEKRARQREAQRQWRARNLETVRERHREQERQRRARVREDPELHAKQLQEKRQYEAARKAAWSPEEIERNRTRGREWARENYLYSLWRNMLDRCHNPNHKSWPGYGGRGITVYEPWHGDFPAFKSWVLDNLGPRPEGRYPSGRSWYSLDRVDNDGGYVPGNLQWATQSAQTVNRRKVYRLEARIAELQAELSGLKDQAGRD